MPNSELSRVQNAERALRKLANPADDPSGYRSVTEGASPSGKLLIFAGLPASGKSTLAQAVARRIGGVYVRVDTIEQALQDLGLVGAPQAGYELAYRVALDNLRLGRDVVADSCNAIELSRREWERVALNAGAAYANIEVVCSDTGEHRSRVESRTVDVPNLKLPTWADVLSREYHPWTMERLVIDTAGRSPAESETELLDLLAEHRRGRAGSNTG